MALTRQQERFLNLTAESAEKLAAGIEAGEKLAAVYADVAASGNPPTDADCRAFIGFGLSEIGAYIGAVQAFVALRDNGAPEQGDHGAALNLVRCL